MSLQIGDVVIETTPSGRRVEHTVLALDCPPMNPSADPGPYVKLSDSRRGGVPLLMRHEDIVAAYWMEYPKVNERE